MRVVAVIAALLGPVSATAQSGSPTSTGLYAGAEGGIIEHHFFIQTTANGVSDAGRYYRAWGVGGGIFLGNDFRIAPRLRAGVEASITTGGADNVANLGSGRELRYSPQFGFRTTARVGALIGDRSMFYILGGYGGNRYSITNTARVDDTHAWGSSFVIGTGLQHMISRRLGIRVEYKHVDNQSHQFFVGLPVRF